MPQMGAIFLSFGAYEAPCEAVPLNIGWYIVFRDITTHAIRAILLANATATSLKGFFARSERAQLARGVLVLPDLML